LHQQGDINQIQFRSRDIAALAMSRAVGIEFQIGAAVADDPINDHWRAAW